MGQLDTLIWAIIIQLFYAFGITLLVYALPLTSATYYDMWQGPTDNINLQNTATLVEDNLQEQLAVPSSGGTNVIDIGILVWYSGNIFVDLMFNFLTALPQLINIIISGLFIFVPIDSKVATQFKLFITISVSIILIVGTIMSFLLGMRSSNLNVR